MIYSWSAMAWLHLHTRDSTSLILYIVLSPEKTQKKGEAADGQVMDIHFAQLIINMAAGGSVEKT